MKKDVEVCCPCCGTRLLVDIITGKVLRQRRADSQGAETSASLDDIASEVVERKKSIPSAFDSAVSTVKNRRAGLEDSFEKAVQKEKKGKKEGKDEGEKR
jgi:hypothetical protein